MGVTYGTDVLAWQWIVLMTIHRLIFILHKNYVPPPKGRGTNWFWCGPDGVGIGVGISVGIALSCLHNILWTGGYILTKFSWIYNWDITKNWLDFGDIDLIFKITVVERVFCWKFYPACLALMNDPTIFWRRKKVVEMLNRVNYLKAHKMCHKNFLSAHTLKVFSYLLSGCNLNT